MNVKKFEQCRDCRWECGINTQPKILEKIFRNNIPRCRLTTRANYSRYFTNFLLGIGIYVGFRIISDIEFRYVKQFGVDSKDEEWSLTVWKGEKWGKIVKEIKDEKD